MTTVRRRAKRGLISTERASAGRVVQDYAVDQFREMAPKKKRAEATARQCGHQLGPWRKRPGDPYGRQDARCADCQRVATVAVEAPAPYGLPDVYGDALQAECPKTQGE